MAKGKNKIGTIVAGNAYHDGTRVSGPSIDGRELPEHDTLEVINNEIYLDGVRYDPAARSTPANTATEITDLDTAISYSSETARYTDTVASTLGTIAEQIDTAAQGLAAEAEQYAQAKTNLTGRGFGAKVTSKFDSAAEALHLAAEALNGSRNQVHSANEQVTAAGGEMRSANQVFSDQLGVADSIGAAQQEGGVAKRTDFYAPGHTGAAGQPAPTASTPGNPGMDNTTEPDATEPTVTYTTPEVPRGDLDDYRPGKGLDSVADTVADLKGNWLAAEVTPITSPTGVKFEVTGPRQHIARLADLYGETLPAPVVEPEPAPQPEAAAAPAPEPEPAPAASISGAMSAKPLYENGWGDITGSPVSYHDDGPIGVAVNRMGQDRYLDVDGEPLANVLGVMATDVVHRRRTAQQGVDDLKALQARLPEGSNARNALSWAIRDMDAPPQPVPAVPDGTPEPLRTLVAELNAVPIVRNDPSREMEPLLGLINDFVTGQTSGFRMTTEIRWLRNKRHESLGDCGKFEIDDAVDKAVKALEAMPREALMPQKPKAKKKR